MRGNEVVQQDAHDEGQSNSDRKRDRQPGNVNGGNQQEVGYVEDRSTEQRKDDMSCIRAADIPEEGEFSSTGAAERESPQKACRNNADYVVPIEELKGPTRSEFHGVGPGPPTQHASDHEQQRDAIGFRLIHGPPGFESSAGARTVFELLQLVHGCASPPGLGRRALCCALRGGPYPLSLRNPGEAQTAPNEARSGWLIDRKDCWINRYLAESGSRG